MTKPRKLQSHDDVLEALAEAIDIPDELYELACKRYQSIGEWLNRPDSEIKKYGPDISPQGSFLLGTVIRPVGDADEYDIDLVCKLARASKQLFSMAELKEVFGIELAGYAVSQGMIKSPKDKRRCWTMEYADGRFHADILPSLPDQDRYRVLMESIGAAALVANPRILEQAIAITDNTCPKYRVRCDEWPVSNPKGYAVWFQSRQSEVVEARRRAIVEAIESVYAKVEDVPAYKVKTPLQRTIQLLKRHRDTTFNGDDDKPISIIITTLAAHAYNGEETISEALHSVLRRMGSFIEERNGVKWVSNPVYPKENFADKWQETPRKESNFSSWLKKAQHDFGLYLGAAYHQVPKELQNALSKSTLARVSGLISTSTPAVISREDAGSKEAEKILNEGGATKPWRQ